MSIELPSAGIPPAEAHCDCQSPGNPSAESYPASQDQAPAKSAPTNIHSLPGCSWSSKFRIRASDPSILHPIEQNVLLATAREVLKIFGVPHQNGSFCLYGQPTGGEAQLILFFDFPKGVQSCRVSGKHTRAITSAERVQRSIDRIIDPQSSSPGKSSSGFYSRYGDLVLTVNANYGRFTMSTFFCKCCQHGFPAHTAVMQAVVAALAKLRSRDNVLEDWINHIYAEMQLAGSKYGVKAIDVAESMIVKAAHPAIKEWEFAVARSEIDITQPFFR